MTDTDYLLKFLQRCQAVTDEHDKHLTKSDLEFKLGIQLLKMFEEVAKEKGIERRTIGEDEILKRLSWALLNTGCMILEEGYALRASDIDVIYTYGYGYPSWRGGPMKYAEIYGLEKVMEDIKNFRNRGDGMWPKSNLLEALAKGSKKFD